MKKLLLLSIFALFFVCVSTAQSDGERMLEQAQSWYDNKEYQRAIKMLTTIMEDEEYKDYAKNASKLLEKCKEKVEEANKFKQAPNPAQASPPIEATPRPVKKPEDPNAKRTAYMKNIRVKFYITDNEGNNIKYLDNNTYASDIRYLKPVIEYDCLVDEGKHVSIDYKIIKPNGDIIKEKNSHGKYTDSENMYVSTKCFHEFEKLYRIDGGFYGGTYSFILYYNGNQIYETKFVLKDIENDLSRGDWKKNLNKCCHKPSQHFSGSLYKGEITDGQRIGLGIYYWINDGKYYIGDWSFDNQDGIGINIASEKRYINNCAKYKCKYFVGDHLSGSKSGEGRCYDRLGSMVYKGDFIHDQPTEEVPESGYDDVYRFECIKYDNGDCYVGETYYGKRSGAGFYMWDSGDMWYGIWSDDTRSSDGVYMYYDNNIVVTGKLGIVQ